MTKLFDDTEEVTTEPDIEIPADDPLKPFLDKYKDPAGIAKALLEKDRFINQLKTETAGLRSELTTRSSVEEALDKLLSAGNKPPANTGVTDPSGTPNANSSSSNSLTKEDVLSLLEERSQKANETANLNAAKAKLTELYGNSWKQVLIEKGKEIGESAEFFDSLAKKNPAALLALVGKPQAQSSVPKLDNGSVNITAQAFNQGLSSVRNKAFYDALKSKNPSEYWSPRVQNQLHQDALKLGEAFFT